ncbi:SIS domain-containing protein [Pelagicoccus albus]|uniref:SIS domain-containing protein n=1 Tax=Pelagicoccus albus TaxID=415222 RepID=A0A7X1B765_9BACT|nr:SIS domain-containing protein [Pelagicoccus albus]MBC2606938.1 SIS domain-containing protein [Pelagicoccus albus]
MSEPRYYASFCAELNRALQELEVTARSGQVIEVEQGFELLCRRAATIRDMGRNMFLCGNGASAAFANHMALDWTKAGGVPTFSFSDSALLTAMGNDLGYEQAFSAPLSWYAKSGDLLVVISSSGNSPNILKSIEVARSKGMEVFSFTGMSPDNKARTLGDMNFYVPAETYGITESAHQALLHVWLDKFIDIKYGPEKGTDH